MWNNLAPPGGESHRCGGKLHSSRQRTEDSAASSWLACVSVETVPTVQPQKNISHLLRGYAFRPRSSRLSSHPLLTSAPGKF